MPAEYKRLSKNRLNTTGLKLAAVSLGCSKNRIDTEEILGFLSAQGFVLTDDYQIADVVIVNTCSFIESAQQESINTLLEVAAHKNGPRAKIIAIGCLVEIFGSKILKYIPEIDGAIGVHSYSDLNRFMKILLSGKRIAIRKPLAEEYHSLYSRILTTPAYSVNVKIAEGCSNRCHYCLIPRIRGCYRSRHPEDIITEIRNLLEYGAREINLIAQDTTAYGSDRHGLPDLSGLITMILKLKGDFWLRILYTYPSRIDDTLIELIAAESRICNYLDVPIQHVNDQVLMQMARSYGNNELTTLLLALHKRIPDLALRTTCMVGYPGESREQFNELLDFIQEYPFENLGAFAYSAQKGTIAGNSPKQVPRRVINKRLALLMETQQQVSNLLNRKLIGRRLKILVEKALSPGSKRYYGRTEYQAPEVDGGVYFRSFISLNPGDWVSVEIGAVSPYNLLAVRPILLKDSLIKR